MLALVTGASSGIGRDIARYLSNLGYDLIITARNEEKLLKLKEELKTNVSIITADLSEVDECKRLYRQVKEKYEHIDLLVNNAGFGDFGKFTDTDVNKELSMIDTNIKAVHILMKLFLKDMIARNEGRILNVASIAGFMSGPLMATYYATKSYVIRLSEAVREELRKEKSKVTISVLCPGPVNTNFNNVANVKFNLKGISSEYVAKYAIDKTIKGKFLILPGLTIKLAKIGSKLVPDKLVTKVCYHMQERKKGN